MAQLFQNDWSTETFVIDERDFAIFEFKWAVSFRFSQGLRNLMCDNSKLKADIKFFFFLLRR